MVVILTTENDLFLKDQSFLRKRLKIFFTFEPLIDFNRVSASVMGKKYYLGATKEERAEFIEVFESLS